MPACSNISVHFICTKRTKISRELNFFVSQNPRLFAQFSQFAKNESFAVADKVARCKQKCDEKFYDVILRSRQSSLFHFSYKFNLCAPLSWSSAGFRRSSASGSVKNNPKKIVYLFCTCRKTFIIAGWNDFVFLAKSTYNWKVYSHFSCTKMFP